MYPSIAAVRHTGWPKDGKPDPSSNREIMPHITKRRQQRQHYSFMCAAGEHIPEKKGHAPRVRSYIGGQSFAGHMDNKSVSLFFVVSSLWRTSTSTKRKAQKRGVR